MPRDDGNPPRDLEALLARISLTTPRMDLPRTCIDFPTPRINFLRACLDELLLKGFVSALDSVRAGVISALEPLRTAHRDPEFAAMWKLYEELEKREPEAWAQLGKMTPREMYKLRKVLRLPPRPRGRPAGKRQQHIENGLAALAAGESVPGGKRLRKYVRHLGRATEGQ
jgi:hypothetical protein